VTRSSFAIEVTEDITDFFAPADQSLKIVLKDRLPTTVQRVVLNESPGEQGCEFAREDAVNACLDAVKKNWSAQAVTAAVAEVEARVTAAKLSCPTLTREDKVKKSLAERESSDFWGFQPSDDAPTRASKIEQEAAKLRATGSRDCVERGFLLPTLAAGAED
jgi:hypothetical protein